MTNQLWLVSHNWAITAYIGLKKPTITNLIGQIHKNTTLK